jgi:hypothetical protein
MGKKYIEMDAYTLQTSVAPRNLIPDIGTSFHMRHFIITLYQIYWNLR